MSRLLFAALTLLLLGLPGCGGPPGDHGEEGEKKARPTDPRTLVTVQPIGTGEVSLALVSTGTVESESQADLVPEATGSVLSIHAEEGDFVRRGQLLAVIESAPLDAALERARAELSRTEAELAKIEELHKNGAVSDKDLRDARYAAEAARTTLGEAGRSQGNTRLVSPINGTVALRSLRFGELAGGQLAFRVVDLDHLRVVVQLPERDLGKLRVGQIAVLKPVYDDSVAVNATVERISPVVDSTTGTVRVTITLPEGDHTLRPGQFVSARIQIDSHQDVLVVPRRALTYEEGEPYAYRVKIEDEPKEEEKKDEEAPQAKGGFSFNFGGPPEDMKKDEELVIPGPYRIARKVPVKLGFEDEDNAEILGGIAAGDEIVVVGQANLRDGARVRYEGDPVVEAPKEDDKEADGDKADGDKAGEEKTNDGDKKTDDEGKKDDQKTEEKKD